MTVSPIKLDELRNDDRPYLAWVTRNSRGFVKYLAEPQFQRRAVAQCRLSDGDRYAAARTNLGRAVIKICSLDLGTLDNWATLRTGTADPALRHLSAAGPTFR